MDSAAEADAVTVALAAYLWEEYKYRHDLIWRLLLRVTAVATLLSIAPFTVDDLVKRDVGWWLKFLPALALALVFVSWLVLLHELKLFAPVAAHYTEAQNYAVGDTVQQPKRVDVFKRIIYLFPPLLFAIVLVVAILAWINL